MNIELLQTKCSDFRFNLTKVKIHNTCSCRVIFPLWVCSFEIYSGLMKLDVTNKHGNFQIVVSPTTLYFSFYHANSKVMHYIVHKNEKKFESTNMDLTHL